MIIFRSIEPMKRWLTQQKTSGKKTGFVPTMGALHEGHLSLLRMAGEQNPVTVCSIFVNPTQFNDPADYQHYPVTLDHDIEKLEAIGTTVLFLPSVEEMYPEGPVKQNNYNLGAIEEVFEGAFRPGHFQGVCQIVDKLLAAVEPDEIFMGQKDYQQCMVISKLLKLKNYSTRLVIGSTLREPAGLAMSSRNIRLSPEEKIQALAIWNSMQWLKGELGKAPLEQLQDMAAERLLDAGFHKVDYFAVADAGDLTPLSSWTADSKGVILCAAFLGKVRLIDNLLS